MKIRIVTLALLAAGSLTISAAAYAGPPVNITFKHLGTSSELDAEYTIISQNESLTNAPSTIPAGRAEPIELRHSFIVIDDKFEVTYERVGGTGGCEFSSRLYMVEAGSYYVPAYESSSNRVGGGSSCMDRLSNEKWSEPHQYTATFTVY
ncbi:hypothetical protein [Vreelandella olivaria]|uniref:hypothetical protein n=1 Tax=Vreelandella olivaria TaxID=390919 RepID=UPI00201EC066|nr:hypothetical protein [Halomonas olivaria]